jgi:hypothetical protein
MHRAAVYEDSCDALFSAPQNKQGRHNLPPRFNLVGNDKNSQKKYLSTDYHNVYFNILHGTEIFC